RRDTDDRVLNAIQILSAANDVRVAVITILPGSVTDHRHRMRIAPCAFFWNEPAAENRFHPERIEIIGRDDATRRAFGTIADAQGRPRDFINDERLEQRGSLFVIEELGIGQAGISSVAARCSIQRKHSVLVRNKGIRANQNSFDPAQYRSVRSDSEGKTKNRKNGKAGTAPKHSEPEAKILKKCLHLVRQSARSASIGFTNVARRAGRKHASSATAPRASAVIARRAGLCGETWYSCVVSKRPNASAATIPMMSPNKTGAIP